MDHLEIKLTRTFREVLSFCTPFETYVFAFSHPFCNKDFCLFTPQKPVHGQLKNSVPHLRRR